MVKYALTWVATMSWHLWRIVTLRPAYPHLSDSGLMVSSFLAVYFGAGLLRWCVAPRLLHDAPADTVTVLVSLALYMVGVVVLLERRQRNSALSAVVLGVSAACDLLITIGYLVGVLPSVSQPFTGLIATEGMLQTVLLQFGDDIIEVAWVWNMVLQFHLQPDVVKKSGYRMAMHPDYAR